MMLNPLKIKKMAKSKSFNIFVTALLTFLFAILFDFIGLFNSIELRVFDFKSTITADYQKADTNIVMVALDDNSLQYFEENEVSYPWPRMFYGVVNDYLNYAGAKAIIYDIHFNSKEIGRVDVDAEESERAFANSMIEAKNVFLVSSLSKKQNEDQPGIPILNKHLYNTKYPVYFEKNDKAEAPIEIFQNSCAGIGIVTLKPDADNIVRRIPLLFNFNDKLSPQISFLVYHKIFNGKKHIQDIYNEIPSNVDDNFLINWYGGGGTTGKVFKYYPISSLILSGFKIQQGIEPEISPTLFKGKIVIIGGTAHGLVDYKPVAINSEEPYPGMEIHATILSNLLNKDFIIISGSVAKYILLLVLSFLIPFLFFKVKKIWISIPAIVLIMILYFLINVYAFGKFNYLIDLIIPELTILFGFLNSAVFLYILEGKQKKELRKTFNRYMSPQVIDEILKNPDAIELGGKEIEATVFFSDIKDFTSISEKYPPTELVKYLNEYFSQASNIILEHKAMLDKYIGDAIMAVFGAPIYQQNHALAGCLAALKIQAKLNELYGDGKQSGKPAFVTRIGLNSGKMTVGNIGTASRLDYTAIGDTVNTSSRLEGMNKLYDTRIIISENTYLQVVDFMDVRELDFMTVKGKKIPIRIYELLGEKGQVEQNILDKKYQFEEALKLYRSKEWDEAIKKFENLANVYDDFASKLYISRCEAFKVEPPPIEWDGVFHAKTK